MSLEKNITFPSRSITFSMNSDVPITFVAHALSNSLAHISGDEIAATIKTTSEDPISL